MMEIPPSNASMAEDESMINIKVMQLGKDTISIRVNPDWSVEEFKSKVFSEDYSKGKNVRVIYFGKMLTDSDTLKGVGVKDNSFLHVSVSERPVIPSVLQNAVSPQNPLDQEAADYAFALEEQKQFNPEDFEPPGGGEGSNGDFALGFAMGFVIGMIMMIWIWQPRIPRKQKVGIICGICFNLFMSYMDRSRNGQDQSSIGDDGSSSATPSSASGDVASGN
jgi:hypothetical protein